MIISVDPVVAVFAEIGWLGEPLDTSPALLAGEAAAAVVVLAGIGSITMRGQRLLHREDLEHAVDPSRPRAEGVA